MSLWHTDWYLIEDDRWRGKWLIAYPDDASRFIVGYGIFDEATTENAISILDDCTNRYGKPLEILTDHGSQFYGHGIKIPHNSYGYRWIAETVFSSIKITFGEYVAARKFPHMVREIFLKAALYNMFNRMT
jgi:transposase InsO family protein